MNSDPFISPLQITYIFRNGSIGHHKMTTTLLPFDKISNNIEVTLKCIYYLFSDIFCSTHLFLKIYICTYVQHVCLPYIYIHTFLYFKKGLCHVTQCNSRTLAIKWFCKIERALLQSWLLEQAAFHI